MTNIGPTTKGQNFQDAKRFIVAAEAAQSLKHFFLQLETFLRKRMRDILIMMCNQCFMEEIKKLFCFVCVWVEKEQTFTIIISNYS